MKELICLKYCKPEPQNKILLHYLNDLSNADLIPSLGEDQVLDIKHVRYKAKKFYPYS